MNGKRNGKEKEYYDNNKIKFEDEFKNDLRCNGKGYDNNNTIYELKNRKRYAKEYDYYGNLIFEFEYLNGLKNGKGKEYNYRVNLEFEEEYLNGKRNGKDKEYHFLVK